MLAICASFSTLLDRVVTRRAGGLAGCAGFAVSPMAADPAAGSEIGDSVISTLAGWVSAAAGQGGSAVALPDKASRSNLSQCSTGITLAVENVTAWEGKVSSADGNRDATISAGEGAAMSAEEGAADRNEAALKPMPKRTIAAKTSITRKANANVPALAKTYCTLAPPNGVLPQPRSWKT